MRQALAGLVIGSVAAAFGWAAAAHAAPLTFYSSSGGFQSANPGYVVQSFSGTAVDPGVVGDFFDNYSAPVTIGSGASAVTYDSIGDIFGLYDSATIFTSTVAGGSKFSNLAFGLNNSGDTLVLTFATGVQSFATGLYTFHDSSVLVSAFDSSGAPIGSLYTVPATTNSGDATFFGLSDSAGADISQIQIGATGDQVFLAGGPFAAVPEPMTVLLLGAGLIGLAAVRWKAS